MRTFLEFFAGGGMARAGLGAGWRCVFANDLCPKKAAVYRANWGDDHLCVSDVKTIEASQLPGEADLAWASFPCQDLSLAGAGAGLGGDRSGTFWPFWKLMKVLGDEGRAPRLIVLENVVGALTSHGGRDFASIGLALAGEGYRFGALVIDAVHWVPQSRPRLFVVAARGDVSVPPSLAADRLDPIWHPSNLISAYEGLPAAARDRWIWWRLPVPPDREIVLADLIEDEPTGVEWHTPEETRYIISLMSDVNLRKLENAKRAGRRVVGTIYRRTRPDRDGVKRQRAEVRFDEIAGCLRTPAGGSSRQIVLVVDGENVRSRLLSPREAARLMGLPDSYKLPERYNDAYHLAGDGVVVPVVRFLAEYVLEPALKEYGG